MISDIDIERCLDYLRDNSTKAAQAKANREYLDEYKKVLKATIMREIDGESLGAQEARALADPRYKTHLEAWRTAIEQDEYYKWMRISAETKISSWQTQNANQRAINRI